MNLFTNHRLRALLTWAAIGVATGCQSARSSFSFQPIRQAQNAPAAQVSAAATRPTGAETAATAAPAPARLPTWPRTWPHHQNTRTPQATGPAPTVVNELRPAAKKSMARARPLLARSHATAERGLGTTVFGILGLVALPVALVGLLLSGGGLVWGVVAGAAALAVLVAYLDPFGH